MAQAIEQLQAIATLPSGWDSNGAGAPDEKFVPGACSLLRGLLLAEPNLPKPRIDPTPSGGVQFAWQAGARYFEIELIAPTAAQFYFVDRAAREEAEGPLHVGDRLTEVLRYLRRFAIEPYLPSLSSHCTI